MIKKIYSFILNEYRKRNVYRAWSIRHKKVFFQQKDFREKLTSKEIEEYIKYWSKFGLPINTKTVQVTKNLTGFFNKYIVPEELFVLIIEPFYNKRKEVVFLENKNIYNKWFGNDLFPKDYIHRIDNKFYTPNFEVINDIEKFIEEANITFPIVFKPSVDSYGGEGVSFLNSKVELINSLYKYSNFVAQEKIEQNDAINLLNRDSINTVRVCLLRRPVNGEIVVLNTSIRMGKDGSLDNETAGGIVCNVKKGGILNVYAVDKYGAKIFEHPNSKYVFQDKILPYYDKLLETSIEIAKKLINVNIISLDMCLDSKNDWRCIELNLFSQTIRFAQYAGEPFFGKYTDEVINNIKKLK